MMFIILMVCFFMMSARHFSDGASDTKSYLKVASSFPSGMNNCLLQTIPLHSAPHKGITCSNFCLRNVNCRLFCIKGDDCTLFKTWVTGEYNGTAQDSFGFTSCYTSWFYPKNLAPLAVGIMPTFWSPDNAQDKATNGYFCYEYDSCSITQVMADPYWKGDLQRTYFVSTVVIKPREDGRGFSDVQIRFGNSPTISQNPIFGTHVGATPPAGSVLTFKPSHPMEGRYLSFQTLGASFAVSVCEVQIIEA